MAVDRHEEAETLEAETADLRAIQEALRAGDPGRALALLDRQASLYPDGKLSQERDAARIIALCDLHDTAAARAALARFEHDYPRSPLLDRVRTACVKAPEQ
jgi:outer membrane protein assembly factor BamD (BamD/ComL family)